MPVEKVTDKAGKIALGLFALVDIPQVWSQWHPSVSTYRGGDWPDMETSYRYASMIAWGESLALGGLISWIIGEWWPLLGTIILCLVAQVAYGYFVSHPAPGNPRAAEVAGRLDNLFDYVLPQYEAQSPLCRRVNRTGCRRGLFSRPWFSRLSRWCFS